MRSGGSRTQAAAEAHAGGAETVAGDLVDGAGVEVVHERVCVAVERVRAHGRQGVGDGVERSLHLVVDRRSPVGEPRAARLLQLGVHEAFAHRAARQLENGECRAGRATRLEAGGRIRGEGDQLRQADAPAGRALSEVGEIGDRGDPDDERAGRKGAVGGAGEDGRADVLLPQDLERRVLAQDAGRRGGGRGHEILRIRTTEEVAPAVFLPTSPFRTCRGVSPGGRLPSVARLMTCQRTRRA